MERSFKEEVKLLNLGQGGKLVCVGLFGGSTPIMPTMVVMKGVTVVGSYVGSFPDMQELMMIARSGTLADLPLTTQPLASATQALEDLKAGKIRVRTILHP
jgi:D-arabinose 1-dehydrogenase-like Zn-dependent alcohol dehydrogenase